jgi:hypothetical protein
MARAGPLDTGGLKPRDVRFITDKNSGISNNLEVSEGMIPSDSLIALHRLGPGARRWRASQNGMDRPELEMTARAASPEPI